VRLTGDGGLREDSVYRQPHTVGIARLKAGVLSVVALSLGLVVVNGSPTRAQLASVRPGDAAGQAIIEETCQGCHNDRARYGNMSLESFEVAQADENSELAEKVIRKLRAGMMPPAGVQRPDESALASLATLLETRIDEASAANRNPGRRSFQRLNRAEYERSVRDLLGLDIDSGEYLPLDTKSANFDNIADAQPLSATLMNGYLRAASTVSRLAVGDPTATPSETTYQVTRWASQTDHVEGAPYGTRGGLSVAHTFPADGEYVFRVSFHHETTGALFGNAPGTLHTTESPEQVEISVDGERAALLDIPRWMHVSDPDGVNIWTDPIRVEAGPHRVAAGFVTRLEGPVQDVISPHAWSMASTSIADAYGFTSLPHLRDLAIRGPQNSTGVSDTQSRRKIFTCRPDSASAALPCAREIVERLGSQAYRRPLSSANLDALMSLYEAGTTEGGFEPGIRMALEGILASPHFVFRFEEPPVDADSGVDFPVSDLALASRLSFFLWARGPDSELIRVASEDRLADPAELERQVRRMLADPRAEALATRFASQWLRLSDLDGIHPDVRIYPDFDEQLKRAMRRETELLFYNLVKDDRSLLELFTADYTFVNERLAKHYGVPNVAGTEFRRVPSPDDQRRGLLGQSSILTLTSHASWTSPVLRGKWIMEVLLGSPPPPPPPNVPDLEETSAAEGGRPLTVRERMEQHRASPACSSCHRVIDPLGLALENFDVTGAWRIKDNGAPVDAAGELYDGTAVSSPADLREALLNRPAPLIRTFTENLMAYGIGRRIEYYDMPAVRAVTREAAANDNRLSAFILGVVNSPAFQMKRAE
jgi:hypothetical protein